MAWGPPRRASGRAMALEALRREIWPSGGNVKKGVLGLTDKNGTGTRISPCKEMSTF
jgi:hypothetical protein